MVQKHVRAAAFATWAAVAIGSPLHAQDQTVTAKAVVTPLRVTVTIARYQAEKAISSLPYVLSVNVPPPSPSERAGNANLRMGTRVPILASAPSTTTPQARGTTATSDVRYEDVGTNIDCTATAIDDGRFTLRISIEESSVYEDPAARNVVQVGRPTFRSFRTMDSLILKDGQSAQMSNTPDRMTGETVRVTVAIAVVR